MSDCKCQSVKIYDGKHRCMKCFKEFMPFIKKRLYKPPTWKDEHGVTHYPKPLYEPDVIYDEASGIDDSIWRVKPSPTMRAGKRPL
jgi:hypothetical protein